MSALLYVLNLTAAVTLVAGAGLLTARGLLRHQPALRVEVCLAACVALLACPIVCTLLALAPIPVALGLPEAAAGGAGDAAGGVAPGPVALSALLALWLAGVGVGVVRLAAGWRSVMRLRGDLTRWMPAADVAEPVARALGRPLPPIYRSARIATPVAVGARRPAVILPDDFPGRLSNRALRQVLLHECAHIACGHLVGGVVERAVRLLFWPHPLVALLCRELARAREEVCDSVASQVDGAACYARTLLGIAQGPFAAPTLPSTLALLGPDTSLEERITGLLDPRRNPMIRLHRGARVSVVGAAALLLGAVAAVRVTAAETPPSPKPKPSTPIRYSVRLLPIHPDGKSRMTVISDGNIRVTGKGDGKYRVITDGKAPATLWVRQSRPKAGGPAVWSVIRRVETPLRGK